VPEVNFLKKYRNINIFDLMRYRLPLAGFVSILHRISGALMFFLLPLILYFFELSLISEIAFSKLVMFLDLLFIKLIIIVLSWAFLHHFCAGVRHLIMDLHFWLTKAGSALSAKFVFLFSVPLTVIVAIKLFGGF
tara:strand:+ start:1209 stop:1613 length:405 start_codon:yes stop_codon:yes gene_type:complete